MSILSTLLRLVRTLPLGLARPLGQALILSYLVLHPDVRREVAENSQRFFGRTQGGFWFRQARHLGGNLALMSRMGKPELHKWLDMTPFDGENILVQIMLRDQPVIVLSLHYGLWELLPQAFARKGYRVCVGLGNQNDRHLGALLSDLRSPVPGSWFLDESRNPKNQEPRTMNYLKSVTEMRQALRARALLGFVVDNTSRTRGMACDTIWPGFSVLRTPFVLAQTERAVLVPMFMYQDEDLTTKTPRHQGPGTKNQEPRTRNQRVALRVRICEPVASAEEFGRTARAMIAERPEDWVFWGKAAGNGTTTRQSGIHHQDTKTLRRQEANPKSE